MSEGYEEKGLARAENQKSSIRSRLTTDLGKFCLYQPSRPNLELPEPPTAVVIRCEREQIHEEVLQTEVKSAILGRNESHALECCFGKKLRYRKVKLASKVIPAEAVFSHSAESRMLVLAKGGIEIPDEIEDEVSKLFAVEGSGSGSDEDEAVARAIQQRFNDDEDLNRPCEPLSMHLSLEDSPRRTEFLEDSDLEEFDEFDEQGNVMTEEKVIEMDSDEDPDEERLVNEILQAAQAKKKQISFLDSEDDLDEINF
jgi:hypothetical protein